MNNQNSISSLLEELEEVFANYENTLTPDQHAQKELLSKSLGILAPITDYGMALFESNEGTFYSYQPACKNAFPYPAIQVGQKINSASWVSLTHHEDIVFILKMLLTAFRFLNRLPQKRKKEFSFAYPHRMQNKKGGYDCYIHKLNVVLNDKAGKPWLILQKSSRCTVIPSDNSMRYRLISMEPADLFRKSKLLPKDEYIMLTSREKDVIREVNTGKVCSQVAETLFLSEKTVRKHFRNINRKIGLKSTNHSCLYAAQLG